MVRVKLCVFKFSFFDGTKRFHNKMGCHKGSGGSPSNFLGSYIFFQKIMKQAEAEVVPSSRSDKVMLS